jgi:hypothetical protein
MALTKVPSELSSTPGIVDNSNDTALTIDGSQNFLVGKSSLEYDNTAGHIFRNDGLQSSIRSGGNVADFNRLSSNGEIIRLSKDGLSVGSLQSRSGLVSTIILDPRTNGAGLTGSTNGLVPVDQTGSGTNNVELGSTSSRFNTLYLGNDIAHLDTAGNARLLYDRSSNLLGNAGTNLYGAGIYLGGTAAANYLNEYEEGSFVPDLSFGGVSAGVSWNVQAGKYTKIGNLVTVGVYLYESTGRGSRTGNATVNLPFNLSSSSPDTWLAISNRQGITAGSNKTLTLFGNAGNGYFRFYAGDNSGANNTVLNHTAFSASGGFEVSFTVTYRTDA